MAAGPRRERIAFEKRADLPDGYGNTEGTWTSQFERAAEIVYLRGSEPVIAKRLTGVQPVVINIGYSNEAAAVDSAWRLRNTRTQETYNILSVIRDPKKMEIDFTCETGAGDGG